MPRARPADGLPSAEEAADRHCALPMSPTMGDDEIGEVVGAAAAALET